MHEIEVNMALDLVSIHEGQSMMHIMTRIASLEHNMRYHLPVRNSGIPCHYISALLIIINGSKSLLRKNYLANIKRSYTNYIVIYLPYNVEARIVSYVLFHYYNDR